MVINLLDYDLVVVLNLEVFILYFLGVKVKAHLVLETIRVPNVEVEHFKIGSFSDTDCFYQGCRNILQELV